MTTFQAFFIAVLQGMTELFPISSLGHAVVVPALLGWSLDQRAPQFLPFLVLLHTGTAVALVTYFWRDWWSLFLGLIGQGGPTRVAEARRMVVLIVVATLPAVIVGGLLAGFFRTLFAAPLICAAFLVLNGGLLIFGERLRGRVVDAGSKPLSHLSLVDAAFIGAWQCGALFPGISRAGATMVAGLLRGLNHQASAHFSFLIATPIIIGATVFEARHLLHADVPAGVLQQASIAAVLAGITAFLSTAFLMRYFRNHDDWALDPFAYYCIAFGLGSAAWLVLA
jgi:undecaprenyl-diphosphatase